MKTLSIIILSYNVKQKLLDCLASLPKHSDWETIVVDNASTDGSHKLAHIISKTNIGFAAGNNLGIRRAKGEYILLLNPDTVVYPNTIETVLKHMQDHPEVGAATCRVELPDGSLDYSCHRNFPDPVGSFLHLIGLRQLSKYSSTQIPNTIHEIDALTGAFALIRRSAGDQVGWLDEDYFFNAEDIDFCYRLKESGWKVMYIPNVKITHHKLSSVKSSPASRRRWATDSTSAMRIFYSKHLSQKYPFFVNWTVYFGIWLVRIARLLTSIL